MQGMRNLIGARIDFGVTEALVAVDDEIMATMAGGFPSTRSATV